MSLHPASFPQWNPSEPELEEAYCRAIGQVAPRTDGWFRAGMARLLLQMRRSRDGMLIIADMLEEASHAAAAEGRVEISAQLHILADLPRQLAALPSAGES